MLPDERDREGIMAHGLFAAIAPPLEHAAFAKSVVAVLLLLLFWTWETWQPYFGRRQGRGRHAARNLALAVCNTVILGLAFGTLTVLSAGWTERNQFGLLPVLGLAEPVRFGLALILLDGWMYVWHRANHAAPLLWRFHRMHHSDRQMDVTSATRFHLGEHIGAAVLRLGLIPLLGFEIWNLVVYDALVIAITQFHHADISIGRCDRWLRWLIVTPYMHKVHHSDLRPDTDSNFSTVLSVWDRIGRTFRMRADPKTIVFGLEEFTAPEWQSWWGMWKTPFVNPAASESAPHFADAGQREEQEACHAAS
jgi:sterol desaturase/sphingolipid hydroxylase (fatty acid hydroxylase superfamily)